MNTPERVMPYLWLLLLIAPGCGTNAPPATAPVDNPIGSVGVSDELRSAANDRVAKAVQVATVHFKYKEYEQAEKQLELALGDPAATEIRDAVALLDSVKAAKATLIPANTPLTEKDIPTIPPAAPIPASKIPPTPIESSAPVVEMPSPVKAVPTELPTKVLFITESGEDRTVTKTAVTDEQITALEEKARTVFEAQSALNLYERFLTLHTLSLEQDKKVAPLLHKWKDYAGKGLVRNGSAWISVENATRNADQAEQLIERAISLINEQKYKDARDSLKKASAINKNSIRADFMLGLLNSGVGVNDPPTAEEHFREVLNRSPKHVSALNNLALSEIKRGKFAPAMAHFTQACESAPRIPEINQNLGRLIKEAEAKKLDVPGTLLKKFSKLYSDRTASGQVEPSNPRVGWLYMPMYLPENERREKEAPADSGTLLLSGGGTGFVVSPNYILTNRHVVGDDEFGIADAVRIIDPTDEKHQRTFEASVVAVSNDLDLALVKCSALKTPSVRLSHEIPRRGSDVLALGYPQFEVIGRGLKATRGIVTGLPEAANENMLLFDVEVNSGNSGGPILDKTGAAVGIATVRYNGLKIGNYSGGIPSVAAISFVKQVIPTLDSENVLRAAELSWPDVDSLVSPSTVMLLCYYRTVTIGLNPGNGIASNSTQRGLLHDSSCSLCNGSGTQDCRTCIEGVVQTRENYQVVVGEGNLRTTVTRFRLVKERCPTCIGKGRVDCPACVGGHDPSVSGR